MTSCVVTGGLGFLGREVARKILARGTLYSPTLGTTAAVEKLTLFDFVGPEAGDTDALLQDPRVEVVVGDVTADGVAASFVPGDGNVSVLHFASMMSGNSEQDFDAAWQVNVLAQRQIFEALRAAPTTPRFLFTSSTAILGRAAEGSTGSPSDYSKLLPENTYGFTKAVCELMLNEYTRRGFIDGRGLRLPSIVVRPGKPNAAATGAYSGVVREPLSGVPSELPISMGLEHPVASYGRAVDAMITLLDADPATLEGDRVYNMPSLTTSLSALAQGCERYAAAHDIALPETPFREAVDPVLDSIVGSMTSSTDGGRAIAIGIKQDESVDQIIADYGAEHVLPAAGK